MALHERFGSLPLEEILAPAIGVAEEGVPLPQVIAYYFGVAARRYERFPEWKEVYLRGGEEAYREGEVFRNPRLAETYRRIARDGWSGFYEGETAKAIEAVVRKYGGFLTREDLARQRAEWVDPVGVEYRGHTVWELPPNGQGIAALQMLRMLEPFDLRSMGNDSAGSLHLLIEVKKLAYEDRARYYADPDFFQIPVERLISREYAEKRLELFDPRRASRELPPGDLGLESGDTTYFCVVDRDRNAVSFIQSNYGGFGSGLVPEECGFTLQNRGNLFSLEERHPNVYAPGKRPFHTIIPAMVTREGRPVFAFGVMGGAMQPQGHVQVLVNLLDHGMNVQEAGDAPRFRHGGSSQPTDERMTDGGVVYLESGIPRETAFDLERLGHRVESTRGGFGGYQGIWIDWEKGVLFGASESRKDGSAIGY
jgi:gamma-glutamyltranspeptidase/glutathione hydrolase